MTQEKRLTEELARRADVVHGRELSVDDVRGRAHRIRRRRVATTVAALAVVAAVVVPISLLAGTPGGDNGPEPAPSPTKAVDPNTDGIPTLQDGVIIYAD